MNNMNDNRSYSGLVEKYIGTAYDTVAMVAAAIRAGWLTPDNMQTVDNRESFLDSLGLNLDTNKPYFTRGGEYASDGGAAYYIFLPDQPKSLANGIEYIDPTVSMAVQGQGSGVGLWVQQTPGGGSMGPPGAAGDEGVPGAQGPSGATGGQGANGIQGERGEQGNEGLGGIPGVDGQPGSPGGQGIIGPVGEQGIRGEQGVQGDQGTIGPTGAQGDPGPNGNQGNPGPPGVNGVDGTGVTIQGLATIADIVAKTNVPGDMWISTDSGRDSANNLVAKGDGIISDASQWIVIGQLQGPQGDTGVSGAEGPTGPHGPDGADGPRGPTGAEGPEGVEGIEGPRGQQGVQGQPGHPGRGIHVEGAVATVNDLVNIAGPREGEAHLVIESGDLWIWDTDLTGRQGAELFKVTGLTRSQLLNWHRIGHIQGPPGHDGVQGIQGTRGPQGPVGPRGVQGLKGLTGARGAAGANGSTGARGATGPAGPTVVSSNAGNLAKIISGKIFVRTQILSGKTNPASSLGANGDIHVKYS